MPTISQFGITWYLSGEYTTGQYCNGDYWVVGPVIITGINPASTSGVLQVGRTINGSVLNSRSSVSSLQGFDSAMYGAPTTFVWQLNTGRPGGNDLSELNPLYISSGSLLSTISNPTSGNRPQLTDAAILTVVPSAPASGAFRPSPYGFDKSGAYTKNWNVTGLNYNILRSLPTVVNTPDLSTVANYFQRPWLVWHTSSNLQYTIPSNNSPDYGREISYRVGDGGLSLHLDYTNTQKETLFTRMVQYGIDIYGAAAYSSGEWSSKAGILNGNKFPLVLAGMALSDTGILQYADASKHFIFSEDQQTFYVTTGDTAFRWSSVTFNTGKQLPVGWVTHGLFPNSQVYFSATGTPPVPIATNNPYYVASGSWANGFSLISGVAQNGTGTLITITASGVGVLSGYYSGRALDNRDLARKHDTYSPIDLTMPEAGEQHYTQASLDGRNWASMYYRDIIGSSYIGNGLAAMLMTGTPIAYDVWNWPAHFDYCDRYFPNKIEGGGSNIPAFHKAMWSGYRSLSNTPPPTTQWNNGPYYADPVLYILKRLGRNPKLKGWAPV